MMQSPDPSWLMATVRIENGDGTVEEFQCRAIPVQPTDLPPKQPGVIRVENADGTTDETRFQT